MLKPSSFRNGWNYCVRPERAGASPHVEARGSAAVAAISGSVRRLMALAVLLLALPPQSPRFQAA